MVRHVASAYRQYWRLLLLGGVVVFAPLSLLDLLSEHLQEPLFDDQHEVGSGTVVALIAAIIGLGAGSLLGEVVYAGFVSAVVVGGHTGERRPLREILGHLPIGRLICIDLLWAALIILGFLALLVPGLLFLAWFALVAPAAEIEDRGIVGSFRRSRELVRGHFRLVFAFVVSLLVLEELLTQLADSVSLWGVGDGLAGEWLSGALASLLVTPPYALAAVVLFLRLRDAQAASGGGRPSPGRRPRASRRWRRGMSP